MPDVRVGQGPAPDISMMILSSFSKLESRDGDREFFPGFLPSIHKIRIIWV